MLRDKTLKVVDKMVSHFYLGITRSIIHNDWKEFMKKQTWRY